MVAPSGSSKLKITRYRESRRGIEDISFPFCNISAGFEEWSDNGIW